MADSTINELQEYTKADANGGFVPFQKNNINGRLPISALVGGEENAEIVWDFDSSSLRPSFVEVRDAMMAGKRAYVKNRGMVVGYCDTNSKETPSSECSGFMQIFVFDYGGIDEYHKVPTIRIFELNNGVTSLQSDYFELQETQLVKYPQNGYSEVLNVVKDNAGSGYSGESHQCRSVFVCDLEGVGNARALPMICHETSTGTRTINGVTFTEKAVILYVQDCSDNNKTKMYWWTESGQKGNKTLAPNRMNYESRNLVAEGAAGSYKITLSEEDENKVIDIGVMPNDCEHINFYNASGSSTPDVTRCTIIAKTPSTSSFSSFRATTGLTIVATQPTYGNARLVKVDVTYGIIEPVVIRPY